MSVVKLPEKITVTSAQLQDTASHFGVTVPAADVDAYCVLLSGLDACVALVDAEEDYVPRLDLQRFPRVNIHRPTPAENTADYNAWAYKVEITSTSPADLAGPLAGLSVAVKDNVNIAGVPSLLGTDIFTKPYVPAYDATIVTRLLQAGATIVGKSACENFSMSPTSFTNAHANVQHPMAPGYSTGGSSSGSAALLCAGKVPLAIGGDQGGSIRLPAAYCGLVGLKPTFGLVPYTGIASLSALVDHTGPMTRSVLENALLLGAIAGKDGLDDRQIDAPAYGVNYYEPLLAYQEDPKAAVKGMRIAVLAESLQVDGLDKRVADKVKEAANLFRALGAEVLEVSVPMHLLGAAIWTVANRQGISEQAMRAQNPLRHGVHDVALNHALSTWTQDMFEKLQLHNPAATNALLGGQYLKDKYPGMTDKAINLSRKLKDVYQVIFEDQGIDLLVLPCTPTISNYTSSVSDSLMEKMSKAIGITQNTAPFNVSGHPALSLPIGMLGVIERAEDRHIKLPVGMQLVGGLFEEAKIYRAAFAWEQSYDWRNM
ncbi:amidase signature domain-containing protein [Mycena latifolia]|nr:amidase signature domain-containing protein [Mycena latifolia]